MFLFDYIFGVHAFVITPVAAIHVSSLLIICVLFVSNNWKDESRTVLATCMLDNYVCSMLDNYVCSMLDNNVCSMLDNYVCIMLDNYVCSFCHQPSEYMYADVEN